MPTQREMDKRANQFYQKRPKPSERKYIDIRNGHWSHRCVNDTRVTLSLDNPVCGICGCKYGSC